VQSRHKWIEETLLKDQKPLSETTRKLLSRRSLPVRDSSPLADGVTERVPPRSSLGSGDDALTRARRTIEGRKQSREAAKARVSADMASLLGEEDGDDDIPSFSVSHSSSSPKDDAQAKEQGEDEISTSHANSLAQADTEGTDESNDDIATNVKPNSARAKARERLNATMALLNANYSGKSSKAKRGDNSAIRSQVRNIKQYAKTELAEMVPKKESVLTATTSDHSECKDEEESPTSRRQREAQAQAKKLLEQMRLEAEAADQAEMEESDLLERDTSEKQRTEEKQKQEEEEARLAEEQAEAERLEHERLEAEVAEHERLQEERFKADEAERQRLQEEDALAKQQQEEEEIRQRAEEQAEAESLEAEVAELEKLQKEQTEQERILADQWQKEEDARKKMENEQAAEALEAKKAISECSTPLSRLREKAKAKQAKIEKKLEEERVMQNARLNEDDESPINDKTAPLSFFPIGHSSSSCGSDKSSNHESASPTISFDQIVHISSSGGSATDPLANKPSEISDATSLGQVDRMLYQGKANDNDQGMTSGIPQDESLQQDNSDIDAFHAATNTYSGSGSGSFDNEGESHDNDTRNPEEETISPGPMWKQAAEEAARTSALANDLVPRAASRADTLDPSPSITFTGTNLTTKKSRGTLDEVMSESNDDSHEEDDDDWIEEYDTAEQEEALQDCEWKGFQWNRMLYIVLFAIQAGVLPSFYALMTCQFITGPVPVGEDDVEFELYFGLQQFSPIDSAFQGYPYCEPYDRIYSYSPPTIPQIAGISAIVFGTIPLIVIGVYLSFALTHEKLWIGSMWMLYVAFLCQIGTLSIFLLDLCQEQITCSMGTGAWSSAISSIAWFVMSIEMKLNSPLYHAVKNDEDVVVIKKDSPFISWVKKTWRTFKGEKKTVPSLSRTAMKKQKGRIGKGGTTEMTAYRPPGIV